MAEVRNEDRGSRIEGEVLMGFGVGLSEGRMIGILAGKYGMTEKEAVKHIGRVNEQSDLITNDLMAIEDLINHRAEKIKTSWEYQETADLAREIVVLAERAERLATGGED